MSTIAYNQGNLLSCLESHIIETATLKLKLPSPRCVDLGGWSFLQSLANTSLEKGPGKQPTYIHPLSKQSSYCKLSETSLKFCTENLGSETGTDIAETAIFSSDSFKESVLSPLPRKVAAPRNRDKVKGKPKKFPPPLTTLSTPNSLQVRSRREGGRLIIVAVEAPPKRAYFQAERSHGRLRLSFLNDTCRDNNVEGEGEDERDMDGIILEAEVEMGMEKFQGLRRCMESGRSNKALRDLKPLCVATS